jgi:hypothetical protein
MGICGYAHFACRETPHIGINHGTTLKGHGAMSTEYGCQTLVPLADGEFPGIAPGCRSAVVGMHGVIHL